MSEISDAECERRLSMIRRAIRRTVYTNAALSRRCIEARQRLDKMRYERCVLAKRLQAMEYVNRRKIVTSNLDIRSIGNGDDLTGYFSMRKYANIEPPFYPCWYRCFVKGMTFTIVYSQSVEGDLIFSGSTPQEAHEKLILCINRRAAGKFQLNPADQGSAFFGFNHSSVHLSPALRSWLKIDACLQSHHSFSYEEFSSMNLQSAKDDAKLPVSVM